MIFWIVLLTTLLIGVAGLLWTWRRSRRVAPVAEGHHGVKTVDHDMVEGVAVTIPRSPVEQGVGPKVRHQVGRG